MLFKKKTKHGNNSAKEKSIRTFRPGSVNFPAPFTRYLGASLSHHIVVLVPDEVLRDAASVLGHAAALSRCHPLISGAGDSAANTGLWAAEDTALHSAVRCERVLKSQRGWQTCSIEMKRRGRGV